MTVAAKPAEGAAKSYGHAFDGIALAIVPALAKLAWEVVKRPAISIPVGVVAAVILLIGPWALYATALVLTTVLAFWCWQSPRTFMAVVGRPSQRAFRRFWRYKARWKEVMRECGLTTTRKDKESVPRVGKVESGEFADRVHVRMLYGQEPSHYAKVAGSLGHAFNALSCRVRPNGAGRVILEFRTADALLDTVPALPIPSAEEVDLESVAIGVREDGEKWRAPLLGTHLLVCGATGSGKGSVVWSMLRGIAPAIRDGVVKIYAADGKGGMEFKLGKELFTRYEDDTIEGMAAMLKEVVVLMEARSRRLAGNVRKHVPTVEEPLLLVLIDEFADLATYPVKKVRDDIATSMNLLWRKGRAVGVHALICTQNPLKADLPSRDLIPDRIALRLRKIQVDMALYEGAYEAGARCDEINPAKGTAEGTAYALQEGEDEPSRVRTAFPTDEDILAMAKEYQPRLAKRLDLA